MEEKKTLLVVLTTLSPEKKFCILVWSWRNNDDVGRVAQSV